MKNLIFTLCIIFGYVMINAQAKEEKSADTKLDELVVLLHGNGIQDIISELESGYAPAQFSAHKKELDRAVLDLKAKIKTLYKSSFTSSELSGIYAFYTSDLGKKMAKEADAIAKNSQGIIQNWRMRSHEDLMRNR